jgi:aerobic carbon-monoxide dehydrogenase medium subunit
MKAPPFSYAQASSLSDVFRLLHEAGTEARLLAGGQSLLAALAFRLSAPTQLIDISRVAELKGIVATTDGGLRIGALTTHAELGASAAVRDRAPLLADAVPLIAHPAIRNRGTIGGSLAYADPAAELPACCVALGARIIAISSRGERSIDAASFFTGLLTTALAEDEIIAAVALPLPAPGERSTIVEVARRSGDYAMAGLVARARPGAAPAIVCFGVGATPVTAKGAGAALGPEPWSAAQVSAAQAALDRDLDPPADQHGGPEMKRHLARVLLARAVERLQQPAAPGTAPV